jgi:hypothetical protein
LQKNDLFPYQFLKDLILINQKTNKFLKNPSQNLGKELLSLYDSAADKYIRSVEEKIQILKNSKYLQNPNAPVYYFFIDSFTDSNVIKNDFQIIKENGLRLKEEIAQRKKCLSGWKSCQESLLSDKRIDIYVDSLNSKFDLRGKNVDFPKNMYIQYQTQLLKPTETMGPPYKVISSCWQGPSREHWMYFFLVKFKNGKSRYIAKLADQVYFYKFPTSSENKLYKTFVNAGFIFALALETYPYECPDLTFYPQLITLNFLKEHVKSNKITKENLEKELNYRLLMENQFGLITPLIDNISDTTKFLRDNLLFMNNGLGPDQLIATRSVYSIFYFPFARSIWRTDKKLQYFVPKEKVPEMLFTFRQNMATTVTIDDLREMGYNEDEMEKLLADTIDLLNLIKSLLGN